jgi:Stealth protein CR2, conserved region 2
MNRERFDVVYTWVDDQWPEYLNELNRYAKTPHDRNPNRTRDVLGTLKISLRSLEKYAPWCGNIFIVTCRPQCPSWLHRAHPSLRVVHHDEIMPAEILPTFNSFAIQSYLHEIPGLSRRFISLDDDMLFMRPTSVDDFVQQDGKIRYGFKGYLPRHKRPGSSPWTMTLSNCATILDGFFPGQRHPGYHHEPRMFDIDDCVSFIERCRAAIEVTRRSRFRDYDNVALEALLPQYLVARGVAARIRSRAATKRAAYLGLENSVLWNRFWLWRIKENEPKFLTLNDNFGANPNSRAVRHAIDQLNSWFPNPSAYEIPA